MVSYFLCLQASVLSTMEKLSWHHYTLSNYSVPALALVGDFSFMSSPSLFPLCISCLNSTVDDQIMARSYKVERKTLWKLCNKSLAERRGSNWPKAIWTCVVIVLSEAMFPPEAKQDIREARSACSLSSYDNIKSRVCHHRVGEITDKLKENTLFRNSDAFTGAMNKKCI